MNRKSADRSIYSGPANSQEPEATDFRPSSEVTGKKKRGTRGHAVAPPPPSLSNEEWESRRPPGFDVKHPESDWYCRTCAPLFTDGYTNPTSPDVVCKMCGGVLSAEERRTEVLRLLAAHGASEASQVERPTAPVEGKRRLPSQLLSLREAAGLLGVSRNKRLKELITDGTLKTVKIGERERVPRAEIERLLEEGEGGRPRRAHQPSSPRRRPRKERESPGDRIRRLKF